MPREKHVLRIPEIPLIHKENLDMLEQWNCLMDQAELLGIQVEKRFLPPFQTSEAMEFSICYIKQRISESVEKWQRSIQSNYSHAVQQKNRFPE